MHKLLIYRLQILETERQEILRRWSEWYQSTRSTITTAPCRPEEEEWPRITTAQRVGHNLACIGGNGGQAWKHFQGDEARQNPLGCKGIVKWSLSVQNLPAVRLSTGNDCHLLWSVDWLSILYRHLVHYKPRHYEEDLPSLQSWKGSSQVMPTERYGQPHQDCKRNAAGANTWWLWSSGGPLQQPCGSRSWFPWWLACS